MLMPPPSLTPLELSMKIKILSNRMRLVFTILILSTMCYWAMYYELVNTQVSPVLYISWAGEDTDEYRAIITDSNKKNKTFALPRLNFERFDNNSAKTFNGLLIVPNVIHYIRFDKPRFTFAEYICLRSAFVNQNPDKIYIHTNDPNLSGKYWKRIESEPALYSRIFIFPIELPFEIFGKKIDEEWRIYHGSDTARIRTLMKYDGIYLDNDVYVVQNLDKYRKFEMVIGWDNGKSLGNQVIIANKDARFLSMWLDSYRDYHSDLWYYNAGERPLKEILHKKPELCHLVKSRFGVHILMKELYDTTDWADWKSQFDTIHLLMNHRSYLDPHYKEMSKIGEHNIRDYPFAFGQIARSVMTNNSNSRLETAVQNIVNAVLPRSFSTSFFNMLDML